jgi:integrase
MRQQDLDIGEHRFTDNGGGSYVAHGGWWTLPGAPDPSAGWPGTKNGQTHRVWLSPPALQILDDLAIDNVQLVFAGPRGTPVRDLGRAMQQVCRELRLNSPARPHDLRRTHGTLTTSLGFSRDQMNRRGRHRLRLRPAWICPRSKACPGSCCRESRGFAWRRGIGKRRPLRP